MHGQGLVHRDIRPSNIFLRIEGSHVDTVLTGFGLAVDCDTPLTRTRKKELKDGFSPIELYAHGQAISAYTDVYSLAATLYELLTGVVPASAEARHTDERAFKLPRAINPEITEVTAKAIVSGMQLWPQNRPQTVAAWLAETDAFFDRRVVIKTPNDTFEADQDYERYVRRFQREGQTLAKLKHPNIVSVIGFFKEAGVPCLVMTYVEGVTLHERLRSGEPLAEDEAVEIFRKLAAALHQVHQAGIFHCDIHPGNIMLQRDGEPVLIDFGSAKLLQPTTRTVTTTVNQSFSPYEQQNPTNKPKATLDVYGLAATLFLQLQEQSPLPLLPGSCTVIRLSFRQR